MKLYQITAVLLSGSLMWTLVTGVPFDSDIVQDQQQNDDDSSHDSTTSDTDDEEVGDNTDENEVPSLETCAALYPECRPEEESDALFQLQGFCRPTQCTSSKSKCIRYIYLCNGYLNLCKNYLVKGKVFNSGTNKE